MDTGPELNPESASMHTDPQTDLQPAQKHTDLEFGTKLPPKMHNDPKAQLLAVPLHSDPGSLQASVQEETLDTSATRPGEFSSKMADIFAVILYSPVSVLRVHF